MKASLVKQVTNEIKRVQLTMYFDCWMAGCVSEAIGSTFWTAGSNAGLLAASLSCLHQHCEEFSYV